MNHSPKCIQLNYLLGKTTSLMMLTFCKVKLMQAIHFTCFFCSMFCLNVF